MYHKSSGVYRSVVGISNFPHRISAEKSMNTVSSIKTRLLASEIKTQMTFPPKISRSSHSGPYPGYKGSRSLIGRAIKSACNSTTKAHGFITWLTQLWNLLIWASDFIEVRRVLYLLSGFFNFDMAKYYREILHLLALGEESFEDELRWIVSIVY